MLNRDFRRYAPIGLYLAGLGALVSIGLYIVQRTFNLPLQISLGAILIGLALFVLLDPARTRQALTGRQARYGSNALVLTIAFLGILVVANYLVYNNPKQWDLTEDKANTLTPETMQTLRSLTTSVKAEAFYTSSMPADDVTNLLQNYKTNSQGKFDFEIVDPNADPVRAQQAGVTRDATIVLSTEGRQEQVSFSSEEELTGALVRLANPGERAVYFLTGHGEYTPDSTGERNYSQVDTSLTAKNYTVESLNLLADPNIPEDALAVIVAGPTKPLSDAEVATLKTYVEGGGSLVYLAEPRPVTEFGDQPDPMVEYLRTAWGIELGDDIIIDVNPNNTQPFTVVSNRFGDHAITRRMYSLAIILPSARSVRSGTAPEGVTLTEMAYTTENAWGETDLESLQQNEASADQNVDLIGPVALAVAGENSTTSGRVIVVGDSDFAESQAFNQYGNGDFILNGIDWAAEQENLISLTPRQPIERFMLPPQPYTMGLVLLGSVFLLPGLVILLGILVWLQRRRRG
jgi:ABC-type uncharacterized transport system involved in gliding motility auxiliary subunit